MKQGKGINLSGLGSAPGADSNLMGMLSTGANEALVDENRVLELAPDVCQPDPDQPRKTFTEESISELAASIRANKQRQPIVVSPPVNGIYIISEGERRWRACSSIGRNVRAIVERPEDRLSKLAAQIVENEQREELPPIELAEALQSLVEGFKALGRNKQDVATQLGRSPAWLSKRLSILRAPDVVQELASQKGVADVNALNNLIQLHKEDPAAAQEISKSAQDGTLETPLRETISEARKKVKEFRNGGSLFSDDKYYKGDTEGAEGNDDAPPARQPFNEDQQVLPGVEPGDDRPSVSELAKELRKRPMHQLKGIDTLHYTLDSVIQAFSDYCEDTRPKSFEEAWSLFVQHR